MYEPSRAIEVTISQNLKFFRAFHTGPRTTKNGKYKKSVANTAYNFLKMHRSITRPTQVEQNPEVLFFEIGDRFHTHIHEVNQFISTICICVSLLSVKTLVKTFTVFNFSGTLSST